MKFRLGFTKLLTRLLPIRIIRFRTGFNCFADLAARRNDSDRANDSLLLRRRPKMCILILEI